MPFYQVDEDDTDPISAWKLIVWISCLMQLFTVCREPGCGALVDKNNIKTRMKGAFLSVDATCNSGHSSKVTLKILQINNTWCICLIQQINNCYTRAQLTIPDHLIFISDGQLGPQVARYSTYPGRSAGQPTPRKNVLVSKKLFDSKNFMSQVSINLAQTYE